MKKWLSLAGKGIRIVAGRLRAQGLRTTLLWMYARSMPKLTGVPIMRYSRITPELYVGPQFRGRGKRRLEQMGIGCCINLRHESDDAARGLAMDSYCYLPTVDDEAPSLEHLEKGVAFIREAVDRGDKVYIHCAGGVGRAPTMAAAYLMSRGHSLDEAIATIKRARAFINITPVQMAQLRRFRASLDSASSNAERPRNRP